MKYRARAVSRFHKDLKRLEIADLLDAARAMIRLEDGERLPPEFHPHKLGGAYEGCWECHVKPDLLLIWIPDSRAGTITFLRIGSHQDLFE